MYSLSEDNNNANNGQESSRLESEVLTSSEGNEYSYNAQQENGPTATLETEAVMQPQESEGTKDELLTNNPESEYLNDEKTNANELAQAEINEFLQGNKSFEDVVDYYGQQYADVVLSNKQWKWNKHITEGWKPTKAQRENI